MQGYSLFRLQRFEEALAAVQQQPDDRTVARLNLQAQLHYRMGSSAEAIGIYHQLFKDHKVAWQTLYSYPNSSAESAITQHAPCTCC